MNFNSILIGSDNPQRLTDYYRKLFGEPQYEGEGYANWLLGRGAITVGAHSEVHGSNDQPGRLIWNIETGDVKGDFSKLTEAVAIVVREPYAFGDEPNQAWIATLSDPDGNYFQLTSPFEMATEGGPQTD